MRPVHPGIPTRRLPRAASGSGRGDRRDDRRVRPRRSRGGVADSCATSSRRADGAAAVLARCHVDAETPPVALRPAWGSALRAVADPTTTCPRSSAMPVVCPRVPRFFRRPSRRPGASASRRRARARPWRITTPTASPMKPWRPVGARFCARWPIRAVMPNAGSARQRRGSKPRGKPRTWSARPHSSSRTWAASPVGQSR